MGETILLVGCGNMGRAMLLGWLEARPSIAAHVVEPNDELRERAAALGATVAASADALPSDLSPDLIFVAVKPQVMPSVLGDYGRFRGATFVSVAAGITAASLRAGLWPEAPVIRCMPNTPAAIGAGMMVCVSTDGVSKEAEALASGLLSSSGEVAWIEDEGLMDAVTAVSGSGPAYVFHLIECLGAAGVAAGLPEALSRKLALQTAMGAGKLAAEADAPPEELRRQVTSPGGTTAAALSVLMGEDRMAKMFVEAVEAARARGEELGRG